MKKIFTFLLGVLMSNVLFSQQTISEIAPINKERPADFEYLSAPDSTGKRTLLKVPKLNLNKQQVTNGIPYPILFIHGLNSNSNTWNTFTNYLDTAYGFSYGGRIDYCLNYDESNYATNKNLYPNSNADIALYTPITSLTIGDYYYINFDVGIYGIFYPNGSAADVISNQSAINKQGLAIAYAIQTILQKTGKDKVILMGHSMGGLAAREYLQNWTQADGFHHVAKLATTGTPHGGSDQVTGGSAFTGVDCQSEAYRDLRTAYSGIGGGTGVYLFGGNETNAWTNLSFCSDFYNVDVNCNGTTSENITGLNYKPIPQDLSYACAIGIGSTLGGDGAVGANQANLNNYETLTFPADTFILKEPSSGSTTSIWHTDLPLLFEANMNLLDEPNEYVLSYGIGFGITYIGFTTRQSVTGYPLDYDDYKFSVNTNSNVSVSINNIYLANLKVHIVDISGNTVGTIHTSNGFSNINFNQNLNAGSYYLEIYGTPTSWSYIYPYNFILNSTTITGITDPIIENIFSLFPNPAKDLVTLKASSNNDVLGSTYIITDQLGRQVLTGKITNAVTAIDISQLGIGFYLFQVGNNSKQSIKLIKE